MYSKELNIIKKSLENLSLDESLQFICDFLQNNIIGYDWVGFYFHQDNNLILKSYCGLKTEHTQIPFGKGICGQTAESNNPMIVGDVSKEEKLSLISFLWDVACADSQLDVDEERLIRRIADLIRIKDIEVLKLKDKARN